MIEVNVNPTQILFFDIETIPLWESLQEFMNANKELYDAWVSRLGETPAEEAFLKIGLYPEYSRIVCISAGILGNDGLRIKSYSGDEVKVIEAFKKDVSKLPPRMGFFSGHNIKEFDIPFIIKRCVINGLSLPNFCKIYGKKPWEMNHIIDTLDIWKCGSFKGFTSLEVLALIFGLDNPKKHTKEQSVHELFLAGKLDAIADYCEDDVFTQANIYCKMVGHEMLKRSQRG